MRFLSPRVHGYLDYLVVVVFAVAPSLLGFSGTPAYLSWVLAGVHLSLTLLTAFPLGVVPVVPFAMHGMIELAVGPLLVAGPWILGFSDLPISRAFFIASGVAVFLVWLMTDYRRVPATAATPGR